MRPSIHFRKINATYGYDFKAWVAHPQPKSGTSFCSGPILLRPRHANYMLFTRSAIKQTIQDSTKTRQRPEQASVIDIEVMFTVRFPPFEQIQMILNSKQLSSFPVMYY